MFSTAINLADPAIHSSAAGLDVLRRLQVEQPVYWNALGDSGFWALTKYQDSVKILRSQQRFTSTQGIQVGQVGKSDLPAAGKMMVMSEKGAHRRIKAIMAQQLLPAAVERLVPRLREVARSSVRAHAGQEPFDFVTQIAGKLTISALGELIGIPQHDREAVSEWTCIAFGARTPAHPTLPSELDSVGANAQIFAYFYDLLRARKKKPANDLLSALAVPSDGGTARLNDEEILYNAHLLLAGGHETTRQALAGVAVAFTEHPEEWERLRADSSLTSTAVEEIIRWSAPSLNIMRTATEDVTIRGQLIKQGDQVTMWTPILNRDEEAFPQAGSFDVARDPNRHLSFGAGSHFCLGSWLAKLELRILLDALIPLVTRFEFIGPARRLHSNRTWGHDQLIVRLAA
ncbi:cytochrome P450 [Kibdelosporangium aridum]|uniref:cytochrome P450 n=1 Tax=Kibdelosporangium aridum TaxID=2030 RepID=UPI000526C72A